MAEQRPRIMYFKEYLPTPVCVVLSMFFALVFQFNGGVFLPTAVQMSSALGCIQEDVMMAGYASFIGMTLIFPILFRLKFRFTTRRIFLTVCPVLIVCNLITLHVNSLPIFILVCLVSGFFRMWGTFECFSNMRLSVTPSGNFSVFYPVIYIYRTGKHSAIRTGGYAYQRLGQLALHALVCNRDVINCLGLRLVFYPAFPHDEKTPALRYRLDWRSVVGSYLVFYRLHLYLRRILRLDR